MYKNTKHLYLFNLIIINLIKPRGCGFTLKYKISVVSTCSFTCLGKRVYEPTSCLPLFCYKQTTWIIWPHNGICMCRQQPCVVVANYSTVYHIYFAGCKALLIIRIPDHMYKYCALINIAFPLEVINFYNSSNYLVNTHSNLNVV